MHLTNRRKLAQRMWRLRGALSSHSVHELSVGRRSPANPPLVAPHENTDIDGTQHSHTASAVALWNLA